MMMPAKYPRPGLTLLEVIVAMAIFLVSLGAIIQLFNMGSEHAVDVNLQARTSIACQSKLAEVIVGAQPLSGVSDYTSFTDTINSDLQWKLDVTPGAGNNLWNVKVSVKADLPGGRAFESQLCQTIVDPSVRGSTLDQVTMVQAGTPTTGSGSSSSSTDSSGGTASGGGGTPATGGAAKGGAAKGGAAKGGAAKGGGGAKTGGAKTGGTMGTKTGGTGTKTGGTTGTKTGGTTGTKTGGTTGKGG